MTLLQKAFEVINIIESHGYTALMVGGAVRDFVMSRPLQDIDLATDMPMEQLFRIFNCRNIGKSKNFGILCIGYHNRHFEISSFRSLDSVSHDSIGRGDDKYALFSADALCRDFTINAMAMDAPGNIIDPLGGISDIAGGIVRSANHADRVFHDDPLRMIRGIRFACAFHFVIEPATLTGIKRLCAEIENAAPERIGNELLRLASLPGPDFARGLVIMEECGLLEYILPEISRLRSCEHNPEHHPEGGVLDHTLAALKCSLHNEPAVNLAILFHDAGKADTYKLKDGKHTYYRHEQAGPGIIKQVGQRLKLSQKLVRTICFAAENHMKGLRINEMRLSRVYRLMSDPDWPVLEEVIVSDLMSRGYEEEIVFRKRVEELREKIRHWLMPAVSLPVSGKEIMKYTGLSQGQEVGRLLREVSSWAMDNNITDPDRIREHILRLYTGKGLS